MTEHKPDGVTRAGDAVCTNPHRQGYQDINRQGATSMAYNRISRYQTEVYNDGTGVAVVYHRTTIVRHYTGEPLATGMGYALPTIVLRTGGWKSVTTKRKMNQAANEFSLPFQVWQHKHNWWVRTDAGEFPFDNDTFAFDARTGEPIDPQFHIDPVLETQS